MDKVTWIPRAFNLRMSEDLRERLRAEAKANGRSMNQEIVYRLEQSLRGWKR